MPITENILPHLNYFWHVAKYGSFTKAAKALHISQSAVSLQIKALEKKLQVPLFLRQSKSQVFLSPAGTKLYERCKSIFSEVDVALDEVLEKGIEGHLHVSSPTTFGIFVLIPFVKELETKYPKLQIRLDIIDVFGNTTKPDVDVYIFYGNVDQTMNYEIIAWDHHVFAASPKYLKKTPAIAKPQDLDLHTLILHALPIKSLPAWIDSLPKAERPLLPNKRHISNALAIIEAVKLGMGVSIFSKYPVTQAIETRQLVPILKEYPCVPVPLYARYPRPGYITPKMAVFVQELREFMRKRYKPTIFDVKG